MPSMGCLHKLEEIFHSGGSSFGVEDRKRKNVSCLSKIPRESTWKIWGTITYPFNNGGAKADDDCDSHSVPYNRGL